MPFREEEGASRFAQAGTTRRRDWIIGRQIFPPDETLLITTRAVRSEGHTCGTTLTADLRGAGRERGRGAEGAGRRLPASLSPNRRLPASLSPNHPVRTGQHKTGQGWCVSDHMHMCAKVSPRRRQLGPAGGGRETSVPFSRRLSVQEMRAQAPVRAPSRGLQCNTTPGLCERGPCVSWIRPAADRRDATLQAASSSAAHVPPSCWELAMPPH